MTAPKHRWFRFGLRTMFVGVTAVCAGIGWVAWNIHLMHLRPVVMYRFYKRGGGNEAGYSHKRELPLLWRLWGMSHFEADFELPRDRFTEADRQELQAVFPEVDVRLVDRLPQEVPDGRLLQAPYHALDPQRE